MTAQFLDEVKAHSWVNDHLVNASGASAYPFVVVRTNPQRWDVGVSGCTIAYSTYMLLVTAIANSNGTFTSGGVIYTLHNDNNRAVAMAV